jgi:hypothetical protein
VKLWQFDMEDRTQFRKTMVEELGPFENGVATAELHRDDRELVTYHHLDAGATLTKSDAGGTEMLVISGKVIEGNESLGKGDWLRLPQDETLSVTSSDQGAKVWIKTGHLVHAKPPKV